MLLLLLRLLLRLLLLLLACLEACCDDSTVHQSAHGVAEILSAVCARQLHTLPYRLLHTLLGDVYGKARCAAA